MRLEKLRDLHFSASSGGGWLSAASGLVRYGNRLYIIADDALHLGVFEVDRPGSKRRLITGTLPDEAKARKTAKPDFEVLTRVPAGSGMPFGGLLAMGSGSTDNRRRGVLIPFTATGLSRRTIGIDLTLLHEGLSAMIQDLNIEGAAQRDHDLLLFHRGNRNRPDNLVVSIDLPDMLDNVMVGRPPNAGVRNVAKLPLGAVAGVPLSVTDAIASPNGGFIVTAVAEDTANAYDDGKLVGAAVCRLDDNLKLTARWLLDPPAKIEGIELDGDDLLLITDADDPTRPAELFRAKLPTP